VPGHRIIPLKPVSFICRWLKESAGMKGKCNDERTAECRMIPVFHKGGLVGGKKPGHTE